MFRVAVIYDAKLPYDVKVVSGIAQYIQEGAEFIIYTEEDALKNQRLPDLSSWHGHGILADFDDPKIAAGIQRSKLPTVGFGGGSGWYPAESGIPYFFSDQVMIGQMGADHLMERGFRNFAYCGFTPTPTNRWSEERQRAFKRRLSRYGFQPAEYQPIHATARNWGSVMTSLGRWLRALPKPCGIMCANDKRANHVLEACREQTIPVPDQVAVLGVDNDEILCQLCYPALSSVEQDARQIGYRAAALLHRMMCGEQPRKRRHVIAPIGIEARQSTDVLAIEDKIAAAAVTFIRANIQHGIDVQDVVTALGVSRSTLESRFKQATGHTVHEAIRRLQLEKARRLIVSAKLSLKEIAAHAGFKSVQHMTTLFGEAYGETPGRYRKQMLR